jgi:hypothetical protein
MILLGDNAGKTLRVIVAIGLKMAAVMSSWILRHVRMGLDLTSVRNEGPMRNIKEGGEGGGGVDGKGGVGAGGRNDPSIVCTYE